MTQRIPSDRSMLIPYTIGIAIALPIAYRIASVALGIFARWLAEAYEEQPPLELSHRVSEGNPEIAPSQNISIEGSEAARSQRVSEGEGGPGPPLEAPEEGPEQGLPLTRANLLFLQYFPAIEKVMSNPRLPAGEERLLSFEIKCSSWDKQLEIQGHSKDLFFLGYAISILMFYRLCSKNVQNQFEIVEKVRSAPTFKEIQTVLSTHRGSFYQMVCHLKSLKERGAVYEFKREGVPDMEKFFKRVGLSVNLFKERTLLTRTISFDKSNATRLLFNENAFGELVYTVNGSLTYMPQWKGEVWSYAADQRNSASL